MSKIISILNNKGGVLKTTTIINVASILANKGKKVLVIDSDVQANATASFKEIFNNSKFDSKFMPGITKNPNSIKVTIYDLLTLQKSNFGKMTDLIKNSIFEGVYETNNTWVNFYNKKINANNGKINFYKKNKTQTDKIKLLISDLEKHNLEYLNEIEKLQNSDKERRIDLIPANGNLQFFERMIYKNLMEGKIEANQINQILGTIIKFLSNVYDYILIDAPPSLGLINENIMAATNGLIIPMEMEDYSIQGLSLINLTFNKLKEDYKDLEIIAVLPTKIKTNTNLHKTNYDQVKEILNSKGFEAFNDKLIPFENGINNSILSASTQSLENKILSEVDFFKTEKSQSQNYKAYLNLVERYILK